MQVTITGLPAILKNFEKAHADMPQYFKNAMSNSVTKIRSDAQAIVPVRTGMLKKSITVRTDSNPLMGWVLVGQPYGIYVEEGTWKMRAQPYLKPSLLSNLDYINDQFKRAMQAVVNQLAGK